MAEKKQEAARPRKPEYEMPKPPLGLVHWYSAPGAAPTPAVVTTIGRTAVAVALIAPDSRAMIPKDGVLHLTDPRANTGSPESGFWDFTPEHKALQKLMAESAMRASEVSAK